MRSFTTKLTVAAVSAAVAAFAGWAWLARERPPKVIELGRAHFVDPPANSDANAAPAFVRAPLTPEEVRCLLVQRADWVDYDAYCYFRYQAHIDKEVPCPEHPLGRWRLATNAHGFRDDQELLEARPSLRVLVTGDSHTDGICNNAESFANVLEAGLARGGRGVEVLNAGKGAYQLFNYLGVLERWLELEPDVFVVAVYGGNDFVESLGLYHAFRRSAPPANSPEYEARVAKSQAVCGACFAQHFYSLAYFQEHPEQIEIALQLASDVASEIVKTCKTNGVQPVFVYLPPPFEHASDREAHADKLADVRAALELAPEAERVLTQLADDFVAHVRAAGASCIDLREPFANASELLYWKRDHHLNLAGHALVATQLQRELERSPATQPGYVRATPLTREQRHALGSPGLPPLDGSMLVLKRFPDWSIKPAWPIVRSESYAWPSRDVLSRSSPALSSEGWSRLEANLADAPYSTRGGSWRLSTNSLGWRSSPEPAKERPALRVMIAGDEQMVGACEATETAAHLIAERARLRRPHDSLEVLNASSDPRGLHAVLDVLDEHAALQPHAFVLVVNGTNDFLAAWRVEGRRRAVEEATYAENLAWLAEQSDAAERSVQIAVDVTDEIQRRCVASGTQLLVVYLPPAPHVEGDPESYGFSTKQLEQTRELARNYLAALRQKANHVLDMTSIFEDVPGAEFRVEDERLNPAGQRLVAEYVDLWLQRRGL